jgi:predicted dehydrogenase
VTNYTFDDDILVTAEGGWAMMPGFGFEMSFNIIMEKATVVFDCTRTPAFKLCPDQGEPFTPQVSQGDGYSLEIEHFLKTINGQKVPQIITPAESLDSVRIILAEKESAMTGKEIELR